ncbi:MAG: 2-amino-4-hydroxy-6-hydroxymethyldihydropteridine diphosphokinase [Phocaeicola sp.]
MATVYLGLGTNLGEKESYLNNAVLEIESRIGKITSLSDFYVTEAWGYQSENSYLNAACSVESDLTPLELLQRTQLIEKEMGRVSKTVNGEYNDRVIDIDILLYDNWVIKNPKLTIPHPLMSERLFVLEPLVQIAPDLIHPVFKQPLSELLKRVILKEIKHD